ncbi:FAD-binding oxidoreductase [Hirschia baltica]|uniref:FAD linked oxidase domain protein n=1 Tax=Hirschia baltica (strain ATCC 49814 / DSM 5838 / IFAM 1418) TaxID=582402 RepID=C6XI13_HIRBI|nr:FAD-binding oxidoreductase [Hirschia baltica]ACT58839.1 FAD linked oxidase domain protein [Hirschia baltica ATCC 49814]
MTDNPLKIEFIEQAKQILGPLGFIDAPEDMDNYLSDWRGRMKGNAPFVARPETVEQVSAFMTLCAEYGVAITPQGGNTGLVLGGLPNGEVLLSTKRLRAVRDIDPLNDSVTVEAGIILAELQEIVAKENRLFPLSLAAEGEAQIGGLISTNAGGVAVLKYGMMRDLVLGLEVVMPDGRIWNGLTGLRKDNTAYDLKQLFIGAEGTLGVITAATLKMMPRPAVKMVSWLCVESPAKAVELLALAKAETGGAVSSFELMPRIGVDFVLEQMPDTRDPHPDAKSPWYVLMEISFPREEGARNVLEGLLEKALEAEIVTDGVLAESETQAFEIWKIRETLPLAEKAFGKAVKHDVSVPVSALPGFIQEANKLVYAIAPNANIISFGHVGDGNMHYNVAPPEGVDDVEFSKEYGPALTKAVHDLVCEMSGSISAEHGIGTMKRDELAERVSGVELDMLRAVKRALDPENRMNPNRVVGI